MNGSLNSCRRHKGVIESGYAHREGPHIMNILSIPGRVCRFVIPCCLLAVVAVADDDSAAGSDADSDTDSGEYFKLEKCIQTQQIRRTYIVDDRTIIFYMSRKKIYMNQLPHRCSGLRIAGTFSYRLTAAGTRLCNIDLITVVRPFGGLSNTGASCGLGMFRPVTEEEVAMIRNKEVEAPPQDPAPAEASDESTSGESEVDDSEADNSTSD